MEQAFREIHRVLKPGKVLSLYVSDSYVHGNPPRFYPIGFRAFFADDKSRL